MHLRLFFKKRPLETLCYMSRYSRKKGRSAQAHTGQQSQREEPGAPHPAYAQSGKIQHVLSSDASASSVLACILLHHVMSTSEFSMGHTIPSTGPSKSAVLLP